jgi:hypothetical protein
MGMKDPELIEVDGELRVLGRTEAFRQFFAAPPPVLMTSKGRERLAEFCVRGNDKFYTREEIKSRIQRVLMRLARRMEDTRMNEWPKHLGLTAENWCIFPSGDLWTFEQYVAAVEQAAKAGIEIPLPTLIGFSRSRLRKALRVVNHHKRQPAHTAAEGATTNVVPES